MIVVEHAKDLAPWLGKEIGTSRWIEITESMIIDFGRITGNTHWLHTDVERAKRETPYGGIIAHGFLTLSLTNSVIDELFEVKGATRWLNYGVDKLRFTNAVKAGERVRLRLTLKELEEQKPGVVRLVCGCAMEIENSERPAMVADYIMIAYH